MAQISRRVAEAFSALRPAPDRISGAFSPFRTGGAEWASPPWASPEQERADIGQLTARDVDALARVVQSEIGHWSPEKLDAAAGPHVASILNRVASPAYGDTVSDVVNRRQQYSAVNPLGSWEKLPTAKPAVQQRVENALYEMAMGRPQTRSTHFLNPKKVGQKHLDRWGNDVVAQAISDGEVFGSPPGNAHYMGLAKGTRLGARPSFSFASGYGPAVPGYVTAERDFQLANRIAPQGSLFGVPEAASVDPGRFVALPEAPMHTGRNSTKRAASRSQRNDIPLLEKLIRMAG
jgi:hypothetical protein